VLLLLMRGTLKYTVDIGSGGMIVGSGIQVALLLISLQFESL
jgi:hypothetical protein